MIVLIGNFDGVHRGHEFLIAYGLRCAQQEGTTCGVITFVPHPRNFFQGQSYDLLSFEDKKNCLETRGISPVMALSFDGAFAALSPQEFVDRYLYPLNLSRVIVGEDFRFGTHCTGNATLLKELLKNKGIFCDILEKIGEKKDFYFSSTRIREALRKGDLHEVHRLLGRNWSLKGVVLKGREQGRVLGFKTLNMDISSYTALAHGSYAVSCRYKGDIFYGVANYGRAPTFEGNFSALLEVHLFDFDQWIYGETLGVEFYHFLRPEHQFSSLENLKQAIQKDILFTKYYFFKTCWSVGV